MTSPEGSRLGVLIRQLQGRFPERVAALPAAPFDGQEIYYEADATGVLWHLRYNAFAVSAYKWEFVGGSRLYVGVVAQDTSISTVYTALPNPLTLTLPLAGDYDIELGCSCYATAPAGVHMSYQIGAAAALDDDSVRNWLQTANHWISIARLSRKTGLAAATALTARYKTSAGTALWAMRYMAALPVRVA